MPGGEDATGSDRSRFFALSFDLFLAAGFDGFVKDLNPGWERVLGFTAAELMSRPYLEFVHPDDLAGAMEQVRRLAEGATMVAFECRVRTRDGGYRWLSWSATPDLAAGLMYCVARDVTEAKDALEAHREHEALFAIMTESAERQGATLRETEARFRAVFESAAIGIALTDLAGRILEANPALSAMLDMDEMQLREARLADHVLPEDGHNDDDLLRDLVAGGRTHYRIEKRFRRGDGTVVPGRVTASLVRDTDPDEPRYLIVMVEDLSLALIDELTGLNNRRAFIAFGEQQLLVADRSNRALTLLFVDVDGMKAINDGFGHQEGDRALVVVARILSRTFRASDFIARIGGDEFCVVLAGTGDDPDRAVHRLQSAAAEWNARVRTGGWRLSLSAGAGRYEPGTGRSMEDLIRQADAAMYRHKMGRGAAT